MPASTPAITWRSRYTLEEREAMIREAAYYRYLARGGLPGHELDDWLEAEREIEGRLSVEGVLPPPLQQSSVHGPAEDEALKRMLRQHPRKAIPLVEDVPPDEAPPRE